GTADRNRSHWSTSKTPSYTKSVSWQHHPGIDPIYFGVMFIINCSIGLITPPIGNVLNVISGVAKLKFDDAVRGVFPYVLVLYSLLVVFVFIPDLIILPLKWIN
ncbi:TRAP transporter large permease subunit, partial [Escherichia coli]|uniref:TRAP transporter large permease subunit n=1 Tax=Escherichia coli TaxID=562 RepID=UPI001F1FBFA1